MSQHVGMFISPAFLSVSIEPGGAILQLSRYRGQRDSTRIPSHFAGEIPLYPHWPTISPVKSDSLINTHFSVDETPLTKHLKSHQTTIKSHRNMDKSWRTPISPGGSSPFFWAGLRLSPHGPRGGGCEKWWGRQLFPAQQVLGFDLLDHPRPGWWMGWDGGSLPWENGCGKSMAISWNYHHFHRKMELPSFFVWKNHWITGDLVGE